VRIGSAWRYMPHDLPPWEAVYQQTQRWLQAGVFEEMVHDLRVLLRLSKGRAPDPTGTILDSRTLQCTPENGIRGGYDGAKRKKGTKVHAAVDTLGHLLALHLTPANEQEREHVGKLAEMLRSPPSSPSPCWCWCCVGWQRLRRRALGSFGVSSEPDRSRRTRLIHSTS
jgi:transposase